jgi:hypothetical protein
MRVSGRWPDAGRSNPPRHPPAFPPDVRRTPAKSLHHDRRWQTAWSNDHRDSVRREGRGNGNGRQSGDGDDDRGGAAPNSQPSGRHPAGAVGPQSATAPRHGRVAAADLRTGASAKACARGRGRPHGPRAGRPRWNRSAGHPTTRSPSGSPAWDEVASRSPQADAASVSRVGPGL